TRIVFDQHKKIESIEPTERNDAHRLIEECMLAANVCAADRITRAKANGVFRVHDRPDPDKVEDLRGFLGEFGLSLQGEDQPEPGHYAAVIAKVREQVYAHVVQTAMLRSLSQAAYSTDCSGHFALGFDRYTHFTSPIRRYPDLVVHRVIKLLNAEDQAPAGEADELALMHVAEHCSMTERRADDATRNVVQWLKAEFMQDHIGAEYWGIITGVTNFGVFVELEEMYVEGLVHVTALGNDYFHFDPVRRRLIGERSGHTFQLGGRLKVRVVRVDLDQAKIDFELVGSDAGRGRKRRRKKRRR
ncbi:MAG: RNB domain-containing ribonuclease, partial [Alphaproteobacteria bacterium]|nr:RNB domain-containing ribonuclease [Alphaproteobacteria bacterium]